MSDDQARVDTNTHTPPLRPSEPLTAAPTLTPTWYLAVYAALHKRNPKLASEALDHYHHTREKAQ